MKTINELLESPMSTSMTSVGETTSTQRSITVDDQQFVNGIFKTLQAIFPAWRQAFPTDDALNEAKRQWALGLIEAGLTNSQTVNAGLVMARKSKNPFIPSVGQFVDWCIEARKQQCTFPSIDSCMSQIVAYQQSRRSKLPCEIDPIAHWIYCRLDKYEFRHADVREARRMLSLLHREAEEKLACGFVFPPVPELIPDDIGQGAPSTPEQIAAATESRNRIKAMFGGAQ